MVHAGDVMPELPEVEITRRHLAEVLEGARVVDVRLGRDRMARHNQRPSDISERLVGRRVGKVGRLGKFIEASVEETFSLVIHLGMSGRLSIGDGSDPVTPHTHLVIRTERGDEVRMIDPRTFGFVAVFTPGERSTSGLAGLGPDAWEALPSARAWGAVLSGRTAPIKALLLDQRIVAGLGNIYADEVLFRARVSPLRAGGGLTPDEVSRLRKAVRPVLDQAIRHGGTSLDDLAYLLPDGRAGENLMRLFVYGRTGERCRKCATPIERVVIAQRSSHYCPTCQS